MVRVKVCGLTNLEDARCATESGADLLGFILYPGSPRYVSPAAIREIVHTLRAAYTTSCPRMVGVLVNEEPRRARGLLADCDLDCAQLHGQESLSVVRSLYPRAYKALRVQNREQILEEAHLFAPDLEGQEEMPSLLLDAYHPQRKGGTGQTFDWGLALEIGQRYSVLLAGGLKPSNVVGAIRSARPWGVDVCSGVEMEPGKKDPQKIRRFIEAAKEAQ